MKTQLIVMDDIYEMICQFKQDYGKEPTHIHMGDNAYHALCDELKYLHTFKDEESDGKNYFMGIEIVHNDNDFFVGLV